MIHLPDAFPWGVATLGSQRADVRFANVHMEELYQCRAGGELGQLFHLDDGATLSSVVKSLLPGQTWTGRIYPQKNRYGIASVNVMLQRPAEEEATVWLYTLEHPKVGDDVRYSSRSELKMLRVLLDNTLEYIYFRDVQGHFIITNKAFRTAVFHDHKIPQMDNSIAEFVTEESAEWFERMDAQLVEAGTAIVNKVARVNLKNGLEQWLQLSVVPVRNGEGELIGTLSVARDISDLKRTEDELRRAIDQTRAANRAKGEFLAAMSHEIRTPINGIIGATELCEETQLDREQRSYIDTVLQCGNTLLGLVNHVLDFSKIEAGQLNLEKLNFLPRTLMENVAESFVQETRKKNVELITTYDKELPVYLMGDPTRLKQVLNNLVSNAVKFTERGEIVVRAETLKVSGTSAKVRFSVSDTGIGISESRKNAIFESFTQEDMSTTRKYGGTGLGLSISRQLVEMMGGTIHVRSEVGRGSVFSFEAIFERSHYHGAEAVPFNPKLAGLRVLIVDDNKVNREIYSQMCAGWGYRSTMVADGSAAIAEMERAHREDDDPYALVILDQQMPGLSGLDVAGMMQSRPDLRQAEVILLSSSLDRQEAERAAELGVARALSKPVKRNTLLEVILETFEVGGSQSRSPDTSREPLAVTQPLEVLLVEDNPVNQTVALQRLRKLGHQVTLAAESADALEYVRTKRFDCILMDIQMPGMDGYETTTEIRKLERADDAPPQYIVAMTAHAMKGDKERCLVAGMDNYISKPFRADRLKKVLYLAAIHNERTSDAGTHTGSGFAAYLETLSKEDRSDILLAAQIFIETLPDEIRKLEAALEANDYDQCYFVAHSVKGVVGHFGQENAESMAEALERASEKELDLEVRTLSRELIESLQMLAREIEAILPKLETQE